MPEKVTLHFKDGSTADMDAFDARRVLREHADEWSQKPFPADVQKAAQEEAEALRLHLADLRMQGKSDLEVERARLGWAEAWAAEKAKRSAPKTVTQPKAFEAKHRGGGSYSIMDAAGAEVLDKLTKEDAELFNAGTVEEQEAFISAEKAKRAGS